MTRIIFPAPIEGQTHWQLNGVGPLYPVEHSHELMGNNHDEHSPRPTFMELDGEIQTPAASPTAEPLRIHAMLEELLDQPHYGRIAVTNLKGMPDFVELSFTARELVAALEEALP